MTNLEKKTLNCIEHADNYMQVFNRTYYNTPYHNGFELLVEKDQISLIDAEMVVVVFNRGYIQLSQIIPLLCEIVEIWGEDDRNIEIH